MRVSRVVIELGIEDLNEMLADFIPDAKIRVLSIEPNGIIGQLRLLLWNIDFVARPTSGRFDEVSIEINASKLVPIPSMLVQRQLKEAIKDAPHGIDVIQQALKVHLPSILNPLGINLSVKELNCHHGFVRLSVEGIRLPTPDFGKKDSDVSASGGSTNAGGRGFGQGQAENSSIRQSPTPQGYGHGLTADRPELSQRVEVRDEVAQDFQSERTVSSATDGETSLKREGSEVSTTGFRFTFGAGQE